MASPRVSRFRRLVRGLTISAVTCLVLGLVLEGVVRIAVPDETFAVFANVYRAHTDPEIVYTLRRAFRGRAFGAGLATNRDGFRGVDRPRVKPAGVKRIALIGDSHTFGYGVEGEQNFGSVLQELLTAADTPVEVWNFAVPGYNSRQQVAVFQRYALPIEPDLVIVVPCGNDADEPHWVDADGWLRSGAPADGERHQPWQQRGLEGFRSGVLGSSRFLSFCYLQWVRLRMRDSAGRTDAAVVSLPRQPPAQGPVRETLRTNVAQPIVSIVAECRRRGIPTILASYTLMEEWRRMFHGLHQSEGVPWFELHSVFREASTWEEMQRRFSLSWDTHMGPEAHRRWAHGLAPFCRAALGLPK